MLTDYLKKHNAKYPWHLVEVPKEQWNSQPWDTTDRQRVFRSKDFLVQIFGEADGMVRISINRTVLDGDRWQDGITWDDLQRIKSQAGYADRVAVEIYPTDANVVDVANLRHLWVYPEGMKLPFGWERK